MILGGLARAQDPAPPLGPAPAAAGLDPAAPPSPAPVVAPAPPPAAPAGVAEAEYQRLLGELPVAPAVPPPPLPGGGAWGLGLLVPALLVIAGLLLWRARLQARLRGPGPGMRLLSRLPLGREGSLLLVEVDDGRGETRRLLLGAGGGAPRLVAELDAAGPVAAGDPEPPPAPRPPGVWDRALRRAEVSEAGDDPRRALERRGDLIAEVLAERGRGRPGEGGGDR